MRSLFRSLLPGAAVAFLAGCADIALVDPLRDGPFFTPVNHVGEPSLGGLRRVLLLPISGGDLAPVETLAAFDPVFAAALQRERRFEVVLLSREVAWRKFRATGFPSASALPPGFLRTLREDFAADAVLFVDLTAFNAYRPLALGLRAKLAALDGGRLVWTFDDVFSAGDPAVANSAQRQVRGAGNTGGPFDFSPGVLQSPDRFAAYAAAAMFATLPPVVPPAPKPAARR